MQFFVTMLPSLFAASGCGDSGASKWLLSFPTWYEYLPSGDFGAHCEIDNFTFLSPSSAGDIVLIVLALIDILLRIAGLLAFFYTLYGGFQYLTSQGEPDKLKSAQDTIKNALVGLAIAMVGAGAVAFVGHTLG